MCLCPRRFRSALDTADRLELAARKHSPNPVDKGNSTHEAKLRYGRLATATVITVAYHSGPALLRMLDSLQGQDGLRESIVVDNGGGGPEIEQARAREGVRVIDAAQNLGFAAGSNLGAREASGSVLVFLNPDTVVAPGAIAQLARTLEELLHLT